MVLHSTYSPWTTLFTFIDLTTANRLMIPQSILLAMTCLWVSKYYWIYSLEFYHPKISNWMYWSFVCCQLYPFLSSPFLTTHKFSLDTHPFKYSPRAWEKMPLSDRAQAGNRKYISWDFEKCINHFSKGLFFQRDLGSRKPTKAQGFYQPQAWRNKGRKWCYQSLVRAGAVGHLIKAVVIAGSHFRPWH